MQSASERSDNGISQYISFSEWKVTFQYTNGSEPRAGWSHNRCMRGDNFFDCHEDTCCTVGHLPWEISQVFPLLKMEKAIKVEIAEPWQQSNYSPIWSLRTMTNILVHTGIVWTFMVRSSHSVLHHILILHRINQTFCEQFSICVSSGKINHFLSDAYLQCIWYSPCVFLWCLYSMICCWQDDVGFHLH